MDEGASVRIGEEGTSASTNGLKFTATMTVENYNALMEDVGEGKTYAKATFGMLIAPASYTTKYGALNFANVFGQESVYGWAKYSTSQDKWIYDGDKVEIINIYGQE